MKTKLMCPNLSKVPIKHIDENGEKQFRYIPMPHEVKGKGIIHCEKCGMKWCCLGCVVECDMVDFPTWEMIYDHEGPTPEEYKIVCNKCSGNRPCWERDYT